MRGRGSAPGVPRRINMNANHRSAFGSIPIVFATGLLLAAQPADRTSPEQDSLANSSQERIYTSQQKAHRRFVDAEETVEEPSGYSLLWERLEALSQADRENAVIQLETGKEISASRSGAIETAESLWSIGLFEEAIEAIRTLEESGVSMAVGISWKTPIEVGSVGWTGTDVRIGNRTRIRETHLDFDAQNGNLFAVLRYTNDSTTDWKWSVNISTDNGQTWQETYQWGAADSRLNDISAVVVDDYLWVGYVSAIAGDEARMRRCRVSDGSIDSAYNWETVIDWDTSIGEIALGSNADSADEIVFYFALSDHSLIFYWASDAGTVNPVWHEIPTGVTNAWRGLDATWNEGASNHTVYASYLASDGANPVVVLRLLSSLDWEATEILPAYTGASNRGTSISAYDDTVICAYEHSYSNGIGIRYNVSYDGGDSWLWGAWEPDPGHYFTQPEVTCRGGQGSAVVYHEEAGDFDRVWFRYRDHYSPGNWDDIVAQINEYDGLTGMPNRVEWLPPLPGHAYAYGTIYISGVPDPGRIPYFDRMMPLVFSDDFESGDTTAWSSTVP